MKKHILLLILMLFISSCKTIKEAEQFPKDAEGYYILKNMTEDQLRKLAANNDFITFEKLMKGKEEGGRYGENIVFQGDTFNFVYRGPHTDEPQDELCSKIIQNSIEVSINPNPTSSSANVKIFSNYDYGKRNPPEFSMTVSFQLIFNERIIRQWSIKNYRYTTETIPDEYLKEGGSYALVCNFTGPRGCTASASASFMVIKR